MTKYKPPAISPLLITRSPPVPPLLVIPVKS